MTLVPIDEYDASKDPAQKKAKGKLIPIGQFDSSRVPDASKMTQAQAVQQLEGGGLQQPAIDPIDLAVFGGQGALQGGLKAGLGTVAGLIGANLAQQAAEPTIQKIPGQGLAGEALRTAARIGVGVAPTLIGGKMKAPLVGEAGLEKAATGAAAKVAEEAGVEAPEQMAERVVESKTAMEEAHTSAEQQANVAVAQAKAKLLAPEGKGSVVPEARQETIASGVGRSPEATQRAVTLPPEIVQTEKGPAALPGIGATARRTQFYNAVYGAKNRASQAIGEKFDKLFAPHLEKSIEAAPIGESAQEEMDYAAQNGVVYSRPVQQLLNEAKDLGAGQAGSFSPQALGYSAKAWGRLNPSERASVLRMAQNLKPDVEEAPRVLTTTGVPYRGPKPTIGTSAGPTIGKMLGLRSRIGEAMKTADGPELAALHNLRESVDEQLASSGVPGAQQLRAQYRGFKTDFGKDFNRAIGKVREPSDAGDALFTEPQRFLQLASGSNREEKATMRDLFGDWVNRGGDTKINKEMAPALKALGFSGPLTKPDAWIFASKMVPKEAELFATSPTAQQKYTTALREASQAASTESADALVKEGEKQVKRLGPTGARIQAMIDAAKTPEDKAQVVTREFKLLDPQTAAHDLSQAQERAGIQAIQEYTPTYSGMYGYMRRYAFRVALLGGPMAVAGHPYMALTALFAGGPVAVREGIAAGWRYSIQRSPEAATQFYRALSNPGAKGSLGVIARNVIEATVADQLTKMSGVRPQSEEREAPDTPTKSGPMVKHIEEKKAENIAGPRGAVSPNRISAIQDTSKQIAAGSAPDIQSDLRNGRMSHGDVAAMLKPDKPGLAALFQGLTPQQAVDAFAHADPHEREMTLPALAQHLHDSKLPPQQMQGILAQLKAVMAPQQQGEETA